MALTGLSEDKQRARAVWDAGHFPTIAKLIESSGELVVERADLTGDEDVLDVACGSGNATIPAARGGARVTGLDLVPSLLEAGRENAAEAGVEVEWVEGDAENLPFEDASFDGVLSVFGVMFAPDHRRAAGELARVLRPGGRMVLANWKPDGSVGRFFATTASHMPPPPEGFQPPPLWGTREHVTSLFDGAGVELRFEDAAVKFRFEDAEDAVQTFETKFGPVVTAKRTLEPEGKWDALRADLLTTFGREIEAGGGDGYDGEYLVTIGTKAG